MGFKGKGVPQIPKDCKIWQAGCTSCGVRNGKEAMCTMVVCKYSKCLPNCRAYSDPDKPPDKCKVWYDGCNNCMLGA